jgi:hypothetical protein
MTNNFKPKIDRQMWVQVPPSPNAHAAGGSLSCDLRNNGAVPFIAQLYSNTGLNRYQMIQKSWNAMTSPALGGTYGAGAGTVIAPSCGLMGSIGAGCTTTSIVTSTSITSVGVNMLANRGDGIGFLIRIKGNAAGSSGKIEERTIVGNTGGTTPTILLDSALSFTPANGDTYEIVACRIFCLGASTLAAAIFRSVEVAANTIASLSSTNLPATIGTDFSAVALDEMYVPYNRKPGEGFLIGVGTYNGALLGCLTATNSAAGTLTGEASVGDYAITANRFRNFQIRIVEDTAIPTAVGQRRIIASHTGGAGTAPVYTMGSNWGVTPSTTAKYVIELPNLILLRSSGTAAVYTYNYSGATVNNGTNSINNDAWHATYFGNAPAVMAAGCIQIPSFGIVPDAAGNAKQSWIYNWRGGGATTCDVLDIAGGTAGSWETAISYDGGVAVNTGSCGQYSPADFEGRYGYINFYTASAINQLFRFDVKYRTMTPFSATDYIQAGTAAAGDRIAVAAVIDGSDKYGLLILQSHLQAITQEIIVLV